MAGFYPTNARIVRVRKCDARPAGSLLVPPTGGPVGDRSGTPGQGDRKAPRVGDRERDAARYLVRGAEHVVTGGVSTQAVHGDAINALDLSGAVAAES